MRLFKSPYVVSFALFVCILLYFILNYSYYPGLTLTFKGELERNLEGAVHWDLGEGFNRWEYRPFTLSSGLQSETVTGPITIQPAGIKPEESRGYSAWLVVPKNILDSQSFTISGKHHWGHFLSISRKISGRQLALFPGSTITFPNNESSFSWYLFKTPQSGYIRVSSPNSPDLFFNGYGKNTKWHIDKTIYGATLLGKIKDLHSYDKNFRYFTLPRYHIKALNISFTDFAIENITPISTLRINGPRKSEPPIAIHSIVINGQSIAIEDLREKSTGIIDNELLTLRNEQDSVEFNQDIYSFSIRFTGKVDTSVVETSKDNNDEINIEKPIFEADQTTISGKGDIRHFTASIEQIKVTDHLGKAVEVKDVDGITDVLIKEQLRELTQKKFHPLLLSVQLLTAALVAWLTGLVITSIRNCLNNAEPGRNAIRVIIIDDGRWLFWSLLFCGLLINGLYLAADWPGSLTPDAISVHKEVKQLQLTNHHPYIYSLVMLGLLNVWDHPVSIIVFQLLIFHLLTAAYFYQLFRIGCRWYLIVPFFLIIVLSIPANLLNITVWKDVPFSILILFWALFLTYGYYRKSRYGDNWNLSISHAIGLSILYVLLCTIRHNGLVYIPLVPLALLIFCNVRKTWWITFSSISLIFFLLYFLVLPTFVLRESPRNDYMTKTAAKKIDRMRQVADQDADYYLEDYLADRVRVFTMSLGTSPRASTWYNDMHNPPQRWFGADQVRADMVTSPLSNNLKSVYDRILTTREFQGFTKGRFIFWNSLFSLCLLVCALLSYRWVPISSFYSLFFLYQAFFMFFVVWPRWRYLYFLYIGGLYLLPLLFCELKKLRENKLY